MAPRNSAEIVTFAVVLDVEEGAKDVEEIVHEHLPFRTMRWKSNIFDLYCMRIGL